MHTMNIRILLAGLIFTQLGQPAKAGQVKCSNIFSYRVSTLSELKQSANLKSEKIPLPKFTKPLEEIEISKNWNGNKGPKLFSDMLPDGISFIEHSLLQANEEGLIKSSSGYLTHLRATIKGVGTNIGANIKSLMDNFYREKKSLVRNDAKAVVVFIHGGGTKTTGHHVAASLLNYFNSYMIDVVSFDMPWHAEGPRTSFRTTKESLDQLRKFIEEFVAPSGKPIILAGHSMGGVIADLYMRTYPNDKLVSAVIPLSTVADPAPGMPYLEKQKVESEINLVNSKNTEIPAEERDLSDSLARQNKISPICGMYCQMLIMGIEWKIPEHNGDNYLPALYIIGEGDGLYQGYQNQFTNNIGKLKNITLKVIGKRHDIRDTSASNPPQNIGHLIFDHKPFIEFADNIPVEIRKKITSGTIKEADFHDLINNGKIKLSPDYSFQDIHEPETFVQMRKFIGKVINQNLNQKTKPESNAFEQVFQAYANNLVFREFAESYIFQYLRATTKTNELGSELASLAPRMRELSTKSKKQNLNAAESKELEMILSRQNEIRGILKGDIIPKSKDSEVMSLSAELTQLLDIDMAKVVTNRKEIATQLDSVLRSKRSSEKALNLFDSYLVSTKIEKFKKLRESTFDRLMKQDAKVRNLVSDYLLNSYSNGQFKENIFENIGADYIRSFERYEKLSNIYQRIESQYLNTIISEALLGKVEIKKDITDEDLTILLNSLPTNIASKDDNQLFENFLASKSLKSQVISRLNDLIKFHSTKIPQLHEQSNSLTKQLEDLEKESSRINTIIYNIQKRKAQLTGDEFFALEHYTIEGLLSQSLTDAKTNPDHINNILQRIWADWIKLWGNRIDTSESVSLY